MLELIQLVLDNSLLQILQLETAIFWLSVLNRSLSSHSQCSWLGREALQRCIMPQVLWEQQRAGKCYLLWKSAAHGNTLFSFSLLNFIAAFGSAHHSVCLPVLFSPSISEVSEVCVYVNVYLHIAPCGCTHQLSVQLTLSLMHFF